ncbi:hypothetical protein L248_3038 [Schleiferilactobacillus shenzhenensis LY-73]|uniref:Uncharacterized protein n=1 Tax=Schleiferilactobacillus shenzhenensis LY-73 TaxID=1231336 RepID=U4TNS8_9LACO|nr:hypothetical protein L248_3038 [Schleiferilactobacillus shenzhenensis LY-73]
MALIAVDQGLFVFLQGLRLTVSTTGAARLPHPNPFSCTN